MLVAFCNYWAAVLVQIWCRSIQNQMWQTWTWFRNEKRYYSSSNPMIMATKHSTSDHISQCICLENRKKTPNSQQIAVQTRNKCRVFQKSTWKLFFFYLHNIFVFKFVSIPSMCSRYFLRIFAVIFVFRKFDAWK